MNAPVSARLARQIVPAAAGLPGADESAILSRIESVMREIPVLGDLVRANVDDGVGDLAALDAATLAALTEVVIVAWASSAEVRAALGARERDPIDISDVGALAQLLEPVRARGPRWRNAP